MRYHRLALAGWLLAGSTLAAQPPAQQPPQNPTALDPANNRLDAALLEWEKAMKKVETLYAELTRTSVNQTFRSTEVFDGSARYMRPNLALLDMRKRGTKPNEVVFERYVCTGTFLYEYHQATKTLRVHELPPAKPGQVADDNLMTFLFGMKAEEAKRRYELKLVKEDQHYVYVEVAPRFPADKADFQQARLVLNRQTYLPRQLWFQQPNGNTILWEIPRIQSDVPLKRTDFTQPQPPEGWTLQRMPRQVQENPPAGQGVPPRVVRPNG